MKTNGLRIVDREEKVIVVRLFDILEEIREGNSLSWSILEISGVGYYDIGQSYTDLVNKVKKSKTGLVVSWNELNEISRNFEQIIWLSLIGCKDNNNLHHYKSDKEMYETCDIVIEMIDSCYWEVFSKDVQLLARLASKFKNVKVLESDFQQDKKE